MTLKQFFMGRAIVILILLFTGLCVFAYKTYSPEVITPVVVENIQPSAFAWKTELDSALNPDGLPKTKVSLDVTYSDGSVQNKFVDTPDGSCNSLDEVAPDAVASTTVLQCYAAGFGYKYKIVKAEKTYRVMRQEFEEGSPEYNPPVQPYKMIAEF